MYKLNLKLPHGKVAIITLIFSALVLFQIGGCTDSGSVGGSLPGSNSDVQVDTLEITGLQSDTLESFSGSLNFFSAGRFQDPLFGDLEATGLIKPALPASNEDLSFDNNTQMRLRLAINRDAVYGDTLADAEFDLIELREIFRGNAFMLNDEVQIPDIIDGEGPIMGTRVGSFTVNNEDTVEVELSPTWVSRYGSFYNSTATNRDSAYVREFFGLAVVPRNDVKIVAFNPIDSRFIATELERSANADTTVSDSIGITPREWAFSLERTNIQDSDPGSLKIISTLERVIRFDFDFSLENLGSRNISRVELVFPRDNVLLDENNLQPGVVRPLGNRLLLHSVEGDELPQSIDPGNPIGPPRSLPPTGFFDEEIRAYRIDVTPNVLSRQLENIDENQSFYLTLGANNGLIRSSILYNSEAAADNRPSVIITSVNTGDN